MSCLVTRLLATGLSPPTPKDLMGFVVDKVALRKIFLRVFRFLPCQYHSTLSVPFYPVSIILPCQYHSTLSVSFLQCSILTQSATTDTVRSQRMTASLMKVKVKVNQSSPEGCRKLRLPHFVTKAQDGGRLSALRPGRLYPH